MKESTGNEKDLNMDNDRKDIRTCFDEREIVENEITFLVDANQSFSVDGSFYFIKEISSEDSLRNHLKNKVSKETVATSKFKAELNEEVTRWEDNKSHLSKLRRKSAELTRNIQKWSQSS